MKKTDLIITSIAFYVLSLTLKINESLELSYISFVLSLAMLFFLIYIMEINVNVSFIISLLFTLTLCLSLNKIYCLYSIPLYIVVSNLSHRCTVDVTITTLLPISGTLLIMTIISFALNLNISIALIEIISLCFTLIYNFVIHSYFNHLNLKTEK